MSKTLWIVAGPNGSGKTTLVNRYASKFPDKVPFINPDDVAKEFDASYDGKDVALIQKAGRETIRRQRELLSKGESFGFETTFSSKRDLKIMDQAKEQGYKVKLAFVGLDNLKDNIGRVKERVLEGGHYVAPEDIVRRYNRAMDNLKLALDKADRSYLFDNTDSKHNMFAYTKNREIAIKSKELPRWVKDNGIDIKISEFKPFQKTKSIQEFKEKQKTKNLTQSKTKSFTQSKANGISRDIKIEWPKK